MRKPNRWLSGGLAASPAQRLTRERKPSAPTIQRAGTMAPAIETPSRAVRAGSGRQVQLLQSFLGRARADFLDRRRWRAPAGEDSVRQGRSRVGEGVGS